MPIYEEKLISPLAVRFTQEHIKTIFRDGHIVEDTADTIEVQTSDTEDYDLVLKAPFPQIEIIRWGHSLCGEGSTGHWFTLDNRRLYCLQRAAAKHWPLRVAAKVDILYADPGAVKRKFDSTTLGASVTVAHSCKDAPLFRWDWRAAVQRAAATASLKEGAAWRSIAGDDNKVTVEMLSDASCGSDSNSVLARALAFELSCERKQAAERSSTPSTTATSEEEQDADYAAWQGHQARWSQTPRGQRNGSNGRSVAATDDVNSKTAQALEEIKLQLRNSRFDGKLRIPDWKTRYSQCLGPIRKFLKSHPEMCTVVEAADGTFTVQKVDTRQNKSTADTGKQRSQRGAAFKAESPADRAMAEIRAQLAAPGEACSVQIHDWNGRYGMSLGPFKAFLRERAEQFTIIPGTGRLFKVALVR